MLTHTRLVTQLVLALAVTTVTVVTAVAAAILLAIAATPRVAPPVADFGEPQAAAQALMTSVTPTRLSAIIGQPYGLRFTTDSATDTDSNRVEVSGTNLTGGGRLDVVLFGALPGSVRAMACEVTRADVESAAGLLGECARVAAGDAGAPVVASWIRTELTGPVGDNDGGDNDGSDSDAHGAWSAVVGPTRYALRAVPAGPSWSLSMSPDGS